MYKYVVIFGYLIFDNYIVFNEIKDLKKFLKKLKRQYPSCHIQIFKSIELELNEIYE